MTVQFPFRFRFRTVKKGPSQPRKDPRLPRSVGKDVPGFLREIESLILTQAAAADLAYGATMAAFYSAPESRLGQGNEDLIRSAREDWYRSINAPVIALLKKRCPLLWREILSPGGSHTVGELSSPALLYRNCAYVLSGRPDRSPIRLPIPQSLIALERSRKAIYTQTLKEHWKGILLLHSPAGPHGYGESWCYDQELSLFFLLTPDDSPDHWNTLEYARTTRQEAMNALSVDLTHLPETEELAGYFAAFQNDYHDLPEIYYRLADARPER